MCGGGGAQVVDGDPFLRESLRDLNHRRRQAVLNGVNSAALARTLLRQMSVDIHKEDGESGETDRGGGGHGHAGGGDQAPARALGAAPPPPLPAPPPPRPGTAASIVPSAMGTRPAVQGKRLSAGLREEVMPLPEPKPGKPVKRGSMWAGLMA